MQIRVSISRLARIDNYEALGEVLDRFFVPAPWPSGRND